MEFNKKEKLKSRKQIARLFSKNSHVFAYPIKLIWTEVESVNEFSVPAQVMISVSKRNVKQAVDRNRIKRLIRESYRLNKHLFNEMELLQSSPILIGFIFVGKTPITFVEVEKGMKSALKKLNAKLIEKE